MTRFAAVGLASFALDFLLLWLVSSATGNLLLAVVVARIISGAANFTANRLVVFRGRDLPWQRAARRYAVLASAVLVANYMLLEMLTDVGLNTLVAKVITEATLFCVSYVIQRLIVFARRSLSVSRRVRRQERVKVLATPVQIAPRGATLAQWRR
jgi:putative flippase GtrA